MKLKIALVGIAHFLMQSPQAQQTPDAKQASKDGSQIEAKKSQGTLPDAFEQKLRDSKGGTVIASPSHETSTGANSHGKS